MRLTVSHSNHPNAGWLFSILLGSLTLGLVTVLVGRALAMREAPVSPTGNNASLRSQPTPSPAAQAAHVAAVIQAQQSAYAITSATNGCPVSTAEILGWPAGLLRQCTYSKGGLTAHVLLLDVRPEVIATWIETECARVLPNAGNCFQTVLRCGRANSGMMFAVSGNMMENMNGPWTNWFFRNGMTVRMPNQPNNTHTQVPIDRQMELALMPDAQIIRIPSGLTRFWRTLPRQFAARFPNETVPQDLATPERRQSWLNLTRSEMLTALQSPNNRLLEAWIAAHPTTIASGTCPTDVAP